MDVLLRSTWELSDPNVSQKFLEAFPLNQADIRFQRCRDGIPQKDPHIAADGIIFFRADELRSLGFGEHR